MALGADMWLALALGLPLLLLAWIFRHSKSLQHEAARAGPGAQLAGRFWQLPLLGESIQFFRASSPDDFFLPRIKRYGPIFRTHLFGRPAVCVTTVEAIKFVLQSPKLFTNDYPESGRRLFGEHSIFHVEGETLSRIRKLVQAPLLQDALKKYTSQVDSIATSVLQDWGPVINTAEEAKRFSFFVALKICCDSLTSTATNELFELFHVFDVGLLSMPFNVPGTRYNKALRARKQILTIMDEEVAKRRAEKGSRQHWDLLDSFLNSEKDGTKLGQGQILDNMLTVLFAAHDTVAGCISLLVRNLCLYPALCQEVKGEHEAIAKGRNSVGDPLTWDDVQNMPISLRFLNETLRIGNVASFGSKNATEDVVYNGMLIPKGWNVQVWPRMFHLGSQHYPDPYKFDPSRFKTIPKPGTFIPFASGYRLCPGRDLAKEEVMIFLHRLILTYEFEAAGPIDTRTRSFPVAYPIDGMPIRIRTR